MGQGLCVSAPLLNHPDFSPGHSLDGRSVCRWVWLSLTCSLLLLLLFPSCCRSFFVWFIAPQSAPLVGKPFARLVAHWGHPSLPRSTLIPGIPAVTWPQGGGERRLLSVELPSAKDQGPKDDRSAMGPWTSSLPVCAGNKVLGFPWELEENLNLCFNFLTICPCGPVLHLGGLAPETSRWRIDSRPSDSRMLSMKPKNAACLLQATRVSQFLRVPENHCHS